MESSLVGCARLNYTLAGQGLGASFMTAKRERSERKAGLSEASTHYHGHRERLRARFRDAGSSSSARKATRASRGCG
jgi:hypothetical protein